LWPIWPTIEIEGNGFYGSKIQHMWARIQHAFF
jgi:hypothetical protein